MTRFIIALVVAGSLLATSWFAFPVWGYAVSGHHHLDPDRLAHMAGATAGSPWLWVNRWRASALEREPWIERVSIVKTFPGRVTLKVTERRPAALVIRPDGRREVIARDGTVLPGAVPPRLTVRGWGGERLEESLEVADLLRPYGVREVSYSPGGFTAPCRRAIVWTDGPASLRSHGGGVTMLLSATQDAGTAPPPTEAGQELRVSVYPWGVSVTR